jgi:hypothetical protein
MYWCLTLQRGVTSTARHGENITLWYDEHCSSFCMLALIEQYLDNIVSKCNLAASCVFMKVLALLSCGRQLLEIISSFCSLLLKSGLSFCTLYCSSCCMLSLIGKYLNNIASKCNWAALCMLKKVLALLWCGRQFLEIISSFFLSSQNQGFFCNL